MPWWIWFLPLAVIAFAIIRLVLAKSPDVVVPRAALEDAVVRLTRAPSGTVLVLLRSGGSGFLQLGVSNADTSGRRVELGLPEVGWSAPRYDQVAADVREAGCEIQIDQGSRCAEVRRYLRASVVGSGKDLDGRAHSMLRIALTALGWDRDEHFTVRFERV